MDSEEGCEDLWDVGTGRLRFEPLVMGEVDDYKRYRAALTRRKDAFYEKMVGVVSKNSSYMTFENGAVRYCKDKIATSGSKLEVFKDSLILHANGMRTSEFERSQRLQLPLFVMAFIISPTPCNLPLGMYVVEGPVSEEKKSWKLRRSDDLNAFPTILTADGPLEAPPQEGRVESSSEPSTGATLVAEFRGAQKVAPKSNSTRFSHNGDDFDSLLECIHREAFRRLGLRYLVTRNSFQIGHLLSEQTQRMYTTDGILYAPVGSPLAPLQVFHVEIKPGPLTVEEAERCRALCQFLNQNVLCVYGGNVSEAHLAEESSISGPSLEYGLRHRFRPCMEMSLYASQGIDLAPTLYPTVIWYFSEGSASPFLSIVDNANPRQREEARLRLLHIYHQATKDAVRFSRRNDPY